MTTVTRRRALTTVPLALSGLLVGCGQGTASRQATSSSPTPLLPGDAVSAPAAAPGLTPAPGPTESAQSTPAWLSEASSRPSPDGSALVVTGVRTGTHAGFDRLVLDFTGPGAPGWDVQWVQEAYTQGKGEPILVEGDHLLLLRGTGVTMPVLPEQQQVAYQGPSLLPVGGAGLVAAYLDPAFEAQLQLVLGTRTRAYRVEALDSPTRLVVDVAHPQA